MKTEKIVLIGAGIAAIVCVVCIGLIALLFGGVFLLTQDIAEAGDDYLEALKQGDYATAYDLSAPDLQREIESPEGLQRFVTENEFAPESWNFNNRSVENNAGTLVGTVTLQNEDTIDTEMYFQKIDGDWLLTGITLDP